MKLLVAIVMAAAGLGAAYWGLNKAVEGQDIFNVIWLAGMIIGVVGILTILFAIKKWITG